jgi:alkanesulfonate monooxygenase SsuD/methylene tetrahydromethanopterin reductase-like flavin-dependent oxidoreductase (luciferase family)
MVGCNSYRNPGLLAKITSTVDVISGGRLDWGIGAGWYENEYRGYGYEFKKPSDRIGMLRETVEIVKSMWTNAETTYEGKYYRLERANCDPKPLQKPTPPVWIGGGGEKVTLRVVAEHADVSNFGSSVEEFVRKREILKGHCAAIGRDEETIRKTVSSEIFIRETEKEILEAGSRSLWGEPAESWRSKALVGTPEQVSEKIQRYLDAGCTGFVPWCPDYPSTETLELFARHVMPSFR